MKALTVWQPWASLIMIGAKPYEFRGHPAPRFVHWQRVVIHAGKRAVNQRELGFLLQELGTEDDGSLVDEKLARPFLEQIDTGMVANQPIAYGCGLGTAVIGEPIRAIDIPEIVARGGDRVDPDVWAWPLSNIEPWDKPIPCNGKQGFWNWLSLGEINSQF